MNIEEQERIDAVNRYISNDEIPSVSTIKRIVKRHNLKVNKRERYKRVKSKKRYTILNPTRIDEMHQTDFVGPRFIRGYGAISSLNLIDVVRNRVQIEQYDSKSMDNVIGFLIPYWSNNPVPKYLQVDNGMCFIGDFRYPRKFSRFIRLCLYVGIEVIFIAPSSPGMNGSIENFNNWFGAKLFWDKETFTGLENIRARSLHFVGQHNDLSAWKKRDKELKQIAPVRSLKNAMGINLDKLPLTDGKIHFIRKVDNKAGIKKEAFDDLKDLSVSDTFDKLSTSARGLTREEVEKRLEEYGYNEIAEKKGEPYCKILWLLPGSHPVDDRNRSYYFSSDSSPGGFLDYHGSPAGKCRCRLLA